MLKRMAPPQCGLTLPTGSHILASHPIRCLWQKRVLIWVVTVRVTALLSCPQRGTEVPADMLCAAQADSNREDSNRGSAGSGACALTDVAFIHLALLLFKQHALSPRRTVFPSICAARGAPGAASRLHRDLTRGGDLGSLQGCGHWHVQEPERPHLPLSYLVEVSLCPPQGALQFQDSASFV